MKLAGILCLALFLFYSSPVTASPETLEHLIHLIEEQRYTWYGYTSAVRMNFKTASGDIASCSGTLDYQRLNEKILLSCFTKPDRLAFTLKTDDDRFSLYLPSQEALFEGNIFDLEFTEKVESHVQPMDLYRALKSMPILPGTAQFGAQDGELQTIEVMNHMKSEPYLERRLTTQPDGHVIKETYLEPDGSLYLEIERHELKKVKGPSMSPVVRSIIMPRHIFFKNHRQNTETEIYFTEIKPVQKDDRSWRLPLPPGTEIVELSQRKNDISR